MGPCYLPARVLGLPLTQVDKRPDEEIQPRLSWGPCGGSGDENSPQVPSLALWLRGRAEWFPQWGAGGLGGWPTLR